MAKFKQKLLIVHPKETHFEDGGLRAQFVYREFGVDKATGGAYNAHLIRGVPGAKPPIAEHKHTELDFLFVYVLKGWIKFEYEDYGEHKLAAGACHMIPPGLPHSVTGWSEDVELIEITSPGKYKTIETAKAKPSVRTKSRARAQAGAMA